MLDILKDIWKILKGEKILLSIDAEDMQTNTISELSELDLINQYQTYSIKSNEFFQEFISRTISKDLKVLPRDFDEEMQSLDNELRIHMSTVAKKENFVEAERAKNHLESMKGIRTDIKNNRNYIKPVK